MHAVETQHTVLTLVKWDKEANFVKVVCTYTQKKYSFYVWRACVHTTLTQWNFPGTTDTFNMPLTTLDITKSQFQYVRKTKIDALTSESEKLLS